MSRMRIAVWWLSACGGGGLSRKCNADEGSPGWAAKLLEVRVSAAAPQRGSSGDGMDRDGAGTTVVAVLVDDALDSEAIDGAIPAAWDATSPEAM